MHEEPEGVDWFTVMLQLLNRSTIVMMSIYVMYIAGSMIDSW